MPPSASEAVQHVRKHRRLPDFGHPVTFNEKVVARKLSERSATFVECADKVAVKEHVARIVGDKYVIPTIWHGVELPASLPASWPDRFVVKANHASGWNAFVSGDGAERWAQLRSDTAMWMRQNWPHHLHERWYNRIPRQILAEEMIGEPGHPPPDYKFFMFDGEVAMIQLDLDRFSGHRRDLYDPSWRRMNATLLYPGSGSDSPRPAHFDQMLDVARALGRGLDFVRVDLYDTPTGPLFGEMTFAPESGLGRFTPPSLDHELGARWRFSLPA
jgi:hypothetical protein